MVSQLKSSYIISTHAMMKFDTLAHGHAPLCVQMETSRAYITRHTNTCLFGLFTSLGILIHAYLVY